MSEWNEFDFDNQNQQTKTGGTGSLCWGMTLAAFLAVTAVSFLIAYLTRYTEENQARPIWMLAICFSAPVAALMLAVYLKEKIHPSMTPSSSRKAQFLLAIASVLLAASIGALCHVSNEQAGQRTVQREVIVQKEVPVQKQEIREGWSDILIIMDKSSSMNINSRDSVCTQAVIDLMNDMDDYTQAALLFDYGWDDDIDPKYHIDFAPLSKNRKSIQDMARTEPEGYTHFSETLEYACKMVEKYQGSGKEMAIIYLNDGEDIFKPDSFANRLKAKNVKFYYIYVGDSRSKDMESLAKQTGGKSIDASKLENLKEDMKELVQIETLETVEVTEIQEVTEEITELVYSDALRDINKSQKAMVVTGVLLLALGILIGFSLTIMFSLQGQKRFQMILSPLMAILAFLLLVFGDRLIPAEENRWILEGIAFSLLGIVLMRSNSGTIQRAKGITGSYESVSSPADEAW